MITVYVSKAMFRVSVQSTRKFPYTDIRRIAKFVGIALNVNLLAKVNIEEYYLAREDGATVYSEHGSPGTVYKCYRGKILPG
eukprot:3425615-Pleurochrysis_carterae.AAC.1